MSDITVIQGTDKSIQITFKEDGVAFDITGWTVYFTVKNLNDVANNDDSALIEKTITSHTTPASGITTLTIAKEDTASMELGSYKYNFALKDPSDNIQATERGGFIVNENVDKTIV